MPTIHRLSKTRKFSELCQCEKLDSSCRRLLRECSVKKRKRPALKLNAGHGFITNHQLLLAGIIIISDVVTDHAADHAGRDDQSTH
jgi:hypothetical protein